MSINPMIARINELSRKQRAEGLAEWEKAEQASLRKEYLAFIRGQVIQALEQAGAKKKPKKLIEID
ncbi:MAG TPA: DUF896 domain-containing protein [Desulfitobacteriaceae bacterium]|nr:DUF896 domain-containing protein [Desulfitobacteriaceae bacterium]